MSKRVNVDWKFKGELPEDISTQIGFRELGPDKVFWLKINSVLKNDTRINGYFYTTCNVMLSS